MTYLISVGSVGRARMNKYSTGAKGYQIVRRGKTVDCYWAGIYVLGPSTYIWRRRPAHTPHRFKNEQAAKAYLNWKMNRLQYSTYGYVPLGAKRRILMISGAASIVHDALRKLRLRPSGGA